MASPEIQRKIGQLRHDVDDVDDVYELVAGMNKLVTKIAGTQQRHSTRLEEIQQALDLTVGRMDRIEDAQRRQGDTLQQQGETLQRQGDTLQQQGDTQRQQYETLNAKLDDIVGLLRGNQPAD